MKDLRKQASEKLMSIEEEKRLNKLNTSVDVGTILRRIADATGDVDFERTSPKELLKLKPEQWNDQSAALLCEIACLKRSLKEQSQYVSRLRSQIRDVYLVSSNTGETGTTRTFNISSATAKSAIIAITSGRGATPAVVKHARCTTKGIVEVVFDVDPGTDNEISIWTSGPNKVNF